MIGTTLPTLQELYLSRVSKRAGKITLDPSHPAHSLFELLPSGRHYRALSTRTTRHRNSFFPQAIHLMNTWHKHGTHNTIIHYLFTTHTYFFISILHISDLYTHNCLYYILCFCYSVHCLFVYLYIIILLTVSCPVLSCCCHSVALWSFCHYNKFLVCVNIPGNKAHSDSDSDSSKKTKQRDNPKLNKWISINIVQSLSTCFSNASYFVALLFRFSCCFFWGYLTRLCLEKNP